MSALAQQLIAENKRTQAKSLDLGNCGLRDLEKEVPELFELAHLEELYLSNDYWDEKKQKWVNSPNCGNDNELSIIPVSIGKLEKLINLYIGGSNEYKKWKVQKIDSLQMLSNLQKLCIYYTTLREAVFLQYCLQLQILDLRYNEIEDTHFLENLTGLQTLNLRSN
ncbi:MAG: hypothetical protein AB8B69_20030, partial [Chitinophagales bacterium]